MCSKDVGPRTQVAMVSMGSLGTQASRPPQLPMDPQASRRVCFYKSGDPQFRGHRMVINARTFKTFDALLDALSKKVPLPFGVRTITTPRGTHPVRCLEDLQDGGSYICSDQRKVKPLNLDMANRRQPPWNNPTRQVSGRRRAFPGGRGVARPAESRVSRVSIRTPKRLIVFKNRDPSVRRTVVLQRRTAPTYDALLDHLSGIMQFPVLKLYTPDGSRVSPCISSINSVSHKCFPSSGGLGGGFWGLGRLLVMVFIQSNKQIPDKIKKINQQNREAKT
uniref:Doublecortin domain-containing protein n=1 Tax=Esox lucius TaxID=8010 RepID=A0A3P8ZQ52_ESOLU